MSFDLQQFAEKYRFALQAAQADRAEGGLFGLEVEWNLLDSGLRPLLTVGAGSEKTSFVDFLRADCLPEWSRAYSQLEVFHWMVEWATRPYYTPRGAVFEARLMEGSLLNALHKAGKLFGERLYSFHGNLLFPTEVGPESIPGSWHVAKRRYLERCVNLYGNSLATAGTHTNLSLPDPLLAWDFMHQPKPARDGVTTPAQLDEYRSEFYITASRLLRAFTALFIATSASTPLVAKVEDQGPVVHLTPYDSNRNLIFPNPVEIDQPDLYRSYDNYLQISYDLIRRGVRFGNNNWTPVRARSFAEPVERLIQITSDQLNEMYRRGLYALGEESAVEQMAHQIEIQNLHARINLPMSRVEVRTDDGGNPMPIEIANLTLKHLLLLRFYADQDFGRAFRYDQEDIRRARRNETQAAKDGLRAAIEHPMTAKPVGMRDFLGWTLDEVRPLAEALDFWEDLSPLREMAAGGQNTAEKMRSKIQAELGGEDTIPLEYLARIAEEREAQVRQDIETIANLLLAKKDRTAGEQDGGTRLAPPDAIKLGDYVQHAREEVYADPLAPVRFRAPRGSVTDIVYPDKNAEILAVAQQLIRIPSVTACPEERLEEVRRAATWVFDYLRDAGLEVRYYDQHRYPAVLAGFPGKILAPVMLSGHIDVVAPEPDDRQFEPRIEGDYLWGRGSADMKTVVATYLVWMKDRLKAGGNLPGINLLLVGNEENGEQEPSGTPHVLKELDKETAGRTRTELLIAGERTGEQGNELWGEICTQNRGVMRFEVVAEGSRGHSAIQSAKKGMDLLERLLQARAEFCEIFAGHLTLESQDGWRSQATFPYLQVGTPGIFNITAGQGVMGIEVRTIPQDPIEPVYEGLVDCCEKYGLKLTPRAMEGGIACSPDNRYLQALIAGVRDVSGREPVIGRKLPGTSARFAPGGQGVVWGQSGLGPHSAEERHFIPSILPYYQALSAFGEKILQTEFAG